MPKQPAPKEKKRPKNEAAQAAKKAKKAAKKAGGYGQIKHSALRGVTSCRSSPWIWPGQSPPELHLTLQPSVVPAPTPIEPWRLFLRVR